MPYKRILAENLAEFRQLEGISQMEIAFRTGVSKETISLIERELSNVRLDVLERLAAYTGLTIPELLTKDFVKSNFCVMNEHE